jgi:hypothetical protein
METDLDSLHWFTSSFSASGACVEVAHLPGGGVAVRDSKDRGGASHVYTRLAWEAFLADAKSGAFDLPVALQAARLLDQPNPPSLALATKAAHSAAGNTRVRAAGCRELLTATCPSARTATSTQLPPVGPLYELFTHRVTSFTARALQLLDEVVDDLPAPLRIVSHDAQPFHREQVAVDVGLLVEVERAGQVFHVHDVG